MSVTTPVVSERFRSDEERWEAVLARDAAAEGKFFYSVRTTGVYCRPTCSARRPNRRNVRFHGSCDEAEAAGFRPCRRCRPRDDVGAAWNARIAAACRSLEQASSRRSLAELAQEAGMSPFHFHRRFKQITGVTPSAYAKSLKEKGMREALRNASSVSDAMSRSGYPSTGRYYTSARQGLGMTPDKYRRGGEGETIRWGIAPCSLGKVLVAVTARGICLIALADDDVPLVEELHSRFPRAERIQANAELEASLVEVVRMVENPALGLSLPLDIRGTVFQQRVWKALQSIPVGTTTTYAELAERIGAPNAVRAVGSACGANPLAIAVPCHRVVGANGSLTGYRWGVERKESLLQRERALKGK